MDREQIAGLLGPDWSGASLELMDDRKRADGLHRLTFAGGDGERINALYLPARSDAAVLYCHAHGKRYDIGMRELDEGRPALRSPWLPEFRARGWGALALEMPCFGARAGQGEDATAKARLWAGRTLFGQMLGEQRAAARWLETREGVRRVAVMGISMGGTLAWWLSALCPGFAAAVSMCCFADLATLVETGAHDGHGFYMTIPGLLCHASTGNICGLAAPTPLLHCAGMADWSTPRPAWARATAELQEAYERAGAGQHLHFHAADAPGHEETEAMRVAVLAFLARYLATGPMS